MREMIRRHTEIWKAALQEDKERVQKRLAVHEAEFLPAALEILESPSSPVGRGILWTIMTFLMIAFLWTIFGRVDIVATASGRIIPLSHAKQIQAAELGVVRDIAVRNGDRVAAGDLLIALDPTINAADAVRIKRELLGYHIVIARQQAILAAASGDAPLFQPPPGTPENIADMQSSLVISRVEEYRAGRAALEDQLAERQADLKLVETELEKFHEMTPFLEEQLAMRKELMDKGLNSRLIFLETQQTLADHLKNIALDEDRLIKERAAIRGLKNQRRELEQRFLKENLAELADAEDKAAAAIQELTKADKRSALQELRAPVDGVVTQLKVHTVGAVVQPAEILMELVPNEGLQIEASILNKDIGFVAEGQAAEIKLEAFPFTRYGVIHGLVEHIAEDARNDGAQAPRDDNQQQNEQQTQTLVYPAKVSLKRLTIDVNGREVRLQPGMAATVEIKTGKRRIIQYILSPIIKYSNESLRER